MARMRLRQRAMTAVQHDKLLVSYKGRSVRITDTPAARWVVSRLLAGEDTERLPQLAAEAGLSLAEPEPAPVLAALSEIGALECSTSRTTSTRSTPSATPAPSTTCRRSRRRPPTASGCRPVRPRRRFAELSDSTLADLGAGPTVSQIVK